MRVQEVKQALTIDLFFIIFAARIPPLPRVLLLVDGTSSLNGTSLMKCNFIMLRDAEELNPSSKEK